MQCRSPTLLLEIQELQTVEQGKYEEEKRREKVREEGGGGFIYTQFKGGVLGGQTIKPAESGRSKNWAGRIARYLLLT